MIKGWQNKIEIILKKEKHVIIINSLSKFVHQNASKSPIKVATNFQLISYQKHFFFEVLSCSLSNCWNVFNLFENFNDLFKFIFVSKYYFMADFILWQDRSKYHVNSILIICFWLYVQMVHLSFLQRNISTVIYLLWFANLFVVLNSL